MKFEGSTYALKQFKENELVHYYKIHIFFQTIMKIEKKHPNSVNFETFIEFLRFLNLKTLRKQIERLESLEYSVSECYEWLNFRIRSNFLFRNEV